MTDDRSTKLYRQAGQIRGLHNASTAFRIIAALALIYFVVQIVRLLQISSNFDVMILAGQVLIGVMVVGGMWAFGLLLDVAAEILDELTSGM